MSHEGVQIRGKDGGAHAVPHESSFDEGILCLTKDSFTSDIREISDSNSLQLSQDGGATISIRGLLAGDGEDLDSFAYDQTSVDPTEWMKSRCKSLGIEFDSVGEENVGDILGLDPESKDNLMTMGGQFLNGAITEDSSIILCTDGVSLVNPISASNDSKCSDMIPICSLADELSSRTEQALCTPDSQSSTSLLHTPSSSVFSDLTSSLSVSESSSLGFQLHDRTRVKLERVTDLESLTPSQTSVQSILGTSFAPSPSPTTSQSLLGSVTNVTAASTADSPVTGILPNFLGIDSTLSTPSENDLELLGDGSGGSGVDSLQQSVFLASGGESMDTEMVSAAAESDSHINLSDPGNVTLATICVSTDKEANSTQILVNTSQGQQLYMINTADLNQATNAIMPLTQASDGQQSVQLQASTVNVAPPAGYLLLPVVEGNVAGNALQGVTSSGEGTSNQKQASREIWLCSEPGCGKAFAKLSKLKIHAMQHTGERPFKCSKQGCDWAFTTAYKLKRHEESHEGKKEYDCDYEGCNRKFTTIYNLNSHRRLHERPCTEHCPEDGCDQSFPTKRQLEIHLRVHTGEEKTYKCPHPGCKAWFFSPNSMGSHARMHKDRPQVLRCEFDGCGKEFDRLCRLKQHVRQHTGEKPYICHFEGCTWAFTTASKLKRHQAKHLGLRKFQCHLCSKGFMRAEHLKGHLITHSGVKPFACPVEGCDVSFTAKSSLYVHLTKHDKDGGKMTFHCPMEGCGKKYSTKLSLRNHIFKHYLSSTEGGSMTGQEIAQLLLGVGPDSDMLKDHDLAGDEASNSMSDSEPSSQLDEGGVEISSDQLTSATVTQLMSSPVTIDAGSPSASQASPGSSLPKITLDQRQSRLRLENRSGSARTDYQSNHLLSDRARRRWHQQRDHTAQNVSSLDTPLLSVHIQGSDSSSEKDVSLMKQDPDSYISPDSSLSGLTFTDPETGITYVQTQLLQDDPPQTVLFSNDAVGLGGDVGGLGEGSTAGIMDMVSASHFTGTTINLQDLV